MLLLNLPNELLIDIASYLTPSSIFHLILTNRRLSTVLTPLMHAHALEPKNSLPALCWAVRHNHEPLVHLLLQKGVDVNLTKSPTTNWGLEFAPPSSQESNAATGPYTDGTSVLHIAAAHASPSIIKILLDAGADLDAADEYRIVPLNVALNWKRHDILHQLVEAGANVNARFETGLTMLHHAAGYQRDAERVRILLSANPDLSAIDCRRNAPLHWACTTINFFGVESHPSVEIVRMLLDAGADANAKGIFQRTPMHMLVRWGARFPEAELILRMLVEKGADVDIRDRNGHTPFDYAISESMDKAAEVLRELGADTRIRS